MNQTNREGARGELLTSSWLQMEHRGWNKKRTPIKSHLCWWLVGLAFGRLCPFSGAAEESFFHSCVWITFCLSPLKHGCSESEFAVPAGKNPAKSNNKRIVSIVATPSLHLSLQLSSSAAAFILLLLLLLLLSDV